MVTQLVPLSGVPLPTSMSREWVLLCGKAPVLITKLSCYEENLDKHYKMMKSIWMYLLIIQWEP